MSGNATVCCHMQQHGRSPKLSVLLIALHTHPTHRFGQWRVNVCVFCVCVWYIIYQFRRLLHHTLQHVYNRLAFLRGQRSIDATARLQHSPPLGGNFDTAFRSNFEACDNNPPKQHKTKKKQLLLVARHSSLTIQSSGNQSAWISTH